MNVILYAIVFIIGLALGGIMHERDLISEASVSKDRIVETWTSGTIIITRKLDIDK